MKCSMCKSELEQVNKGCALFEEIYECTNKDCFANEKNDELDNEQWYWDVFGKIHCKDVVTNALPTNYHLRHRLIDGESSAFESIEREEKNE